MFSTGDFPGGPAPSSVSGTLNGKRFETLLDADPRIGARLEIFAAGQYLWIPLRHVASIRVDAPRRLRDLIWAPAKILTGPEFEGLELGETLIPAISPLSSQHDDDDVRLGRVTEWVATDDGGEVLMGQKLLLVDNEEFPILELRELEINATSDN